MKLCKDCAFFSGQPHTPNPNWPKCHAKVIYTDVVYGDDIYESCKIARVTFCGPEARLFEPKRIKPTIFQKIFKL